MLERFTAALLARRGTATLACLLFFGLVASGATQLRVDFSSRGFFNDGDARAADLATYQAQWGPDDVELAILVSGDDVTRTDGVELIARIVDAIDGLTAVAAVLDPTAIPVAPGGATLADGGWAPGAPPPPFVPALVSQDRRHAAIPVRLRTSSDDLAAVVPAVAEIRGALPPPGAYSVELAGVPAVRAAFFELVVRDQTLLLPLTVLLIGALLWVAFRRMYAVGVAGLSALVPLAMLLGVLGWAGEPIGLLNQAYFTLIPIIAVAEGVHVVERVHEEARRRPHAPSATTIASAMGRVGPACFMATVTTVVGFGSLLIADMPVLRSFGVYAAVGIALSFVTVLTAVPLLLSLSSIDPGPERGPSRLGQLVPPIRRARWAIRIGSVGLLGFSLWAAATVPTDNHLTGLLRPDHPVSRASSLADTSLGGTLAVELDLAGEPGAFHEAATLGTLLDLERAMAREPGVRSVQGPASLLDLAIGTIPAMPTLTRAALAVARQSGAPPLTSPSGDRARISVRAADHGGRAFVVLANRIEGLARDSLPDGIVVRVTGTPLVAYEGINRITTELAESLAVAFLVILFVIAIVLRSAGLALLSMVPNALPLAVAYASVGWIAGELDPLGAVVLVVGLGIAVDDTMHLVARLREELRSGVEPETAIRIAVARSGRAITITTIALAGGLSLLQLSSFPPMALLGTLGALTLATAWLADVVVLPALMPGARTQR